MDRFAQFAVIAAREAVQDAGVEWTPELRETSAIITGSCVGGQSTEDIGFVEIYKQGTQPRPSADHSQDDGQRGRQPHLDGVRHHRAGLHDFDRLLFGRPRHRPGISDGRAPGPRDLAITGGSEAPFSLGILKAWEAMRVVSPETCRPFSKDRRGMILGEGAAMFVLEPLEAAQARGARIHAEMVGFGMSADACHITQPSIEGAARAMRAALRDAQTGAGADRVHQRARHRHAWPTISPRRPPSARSSARTRTGWRSAPRNPCTATRWARRPRWSAWRPRLRCATACSRPPPISTSRTRSAIWT